MYIASTHLSILGASFFNHCSDMDFLQATSNIVKYSSLLFHPISPWSLWYNSLKLKMSFLPSNYILNVFSWWRDRRLVYGSEILVVWFMLFWALNSYKSILIAICSSAETLLLVVWYEEEREDRRKKPLLTILVSCKLSTSGIKTSLSLLPHQQEVRPRSDRFPPILGRHNQFVNGENSVAFCQSTHSLQTWAIPARHQVFRKPYWDVGKEMLPSLRHARLYCGDR